MNVALRLKLLGKKQQGAGAIVASVAKHQRGHIASFCERSDDSNVAYELYLSRHNFGGDAHYSANVVKGQELYDFGRASVGIYTNSGNFSTVPTEITLTRDGAPPTIGAYAVGNDSYKASMVPLVLAMMNTQFEHRGEKQFGYEAGITANDWSSRAGTITFEAYCEKTSGDNFVAGTNAEGFAKLDTIVPEVIAAGGFYQNFMHAENYVGNYAKDYFAGLDTRIGSADVFRGSGSSIVEYYYVRESVDSIVVSGNDITINYTKKYLTSPYNNITTPLWIRVNLNGTALAGKHITTSHGGKIRSMGGNVFFISVLLNFNNTSTSFTISETLTPSYINLNKPVVSVVGNTITTDQPIKYALLEKLKAETEIQVASGARGLTFSSTPSINEILDKNTYDYYLAYINQEGISGLIEPSGMLAEPGGQASNLQSIGGTLIYDFDYRYNRSLGDGMVYSWRDMSTNGFLLRALSLNGRFFANSDGFGDSSSTNSILLQAAHQPALNALHNGTPFIQFAILKIQAYSASALSFQIGSTNSSGNPGVITQILCATGNMSHQAQNDAGTSLGNQNTSNGSIPVGRHILVIRQYYGSGTGTNNVRTYIENVLTQSTYNPTFGTGNSTRLYIGKNTSPAVDLKIKRFGAINLAGMTPSEIETFRATLITAIKSEAEYSSLTT